MRTDRLVFLFALVALVASTACGLLAPPGDYGSEYSNGNDDRPRDAASEDGD